MRKKFNKRVFQLWLYFFIALAICLTVTVVYVQSRMQLEQSQMEQIAMSRANKVSGVLTKLLYKTQVLSAIVVRSNGDVPDFEQMASTILDDPSIRNLILAPDGVVEYVYPLKGNEQVLGLDYFAEGDGNKEAILARDTGQLVLGGPFTLVQGGQALVGRVPVYLTGNVFWGIASVTLNYPQALDGAELDQLEAQGFAYEIWRISPDTGSRQVIASSPYSYNQNVRFVEHPMNIQNAEWYFRLSPIRAWYQFPETWVFVVAGIFISFLIGLLMMHNYDLHLMKKNLEQLSYMDSLTGILNRRGGFQALQALEGNLEPFLLCYMDLDCFKEINDRYGHNAGDMFLQKFSDVIQNNINKEHHIFARIGGDEFILAFKDTDNTDMMKAWFAHLEELLLSSPILLDNKKVSLTFSMGYSCYPKDGTTLDTLVTTADSRMYQCKKSHKSLD